MCGIVQRRHTELSLVVVNDFLINSFLAFCFLLSSMTMLLQLGVIISSLPLHNLLEGILGSHYSSLHTSFHLLALVML